MDERKIIEDYTKRGYQHVHVRRDRPHFAYPPHYHPFHVTLHVLEGNLEIDIDNRKVNVGPDDRIEIDAEKFHTTCMGPAGCVYVHAEKH